MENPLRAKPDVREQYERQLKTRGFSDAQIDRAVLKYCVASRISEGNYE